MGHQALSSQRDLLGSQSQYCICIQQAFGRSKPNEFIGISDPTTRIITPWPPSHTAFVSPRHALRAGGLSPATPTSTPAVCSLTNHSF